MSLLRSKEVSRVVFVTGIRYADKQLGPFVSTS